MTNALTAIPGKRPYHHGDLRRALIRAALRLIEATGPRGFTLREAARLVGVTHPASYRHFRNKAALLAAVAEEGFRGLRAQIVRACARTTEPLARFQQVGIAYVRYAVAHPAHFRVMFGAEAASARDHSLQQARDEAFGLVLEQIVACQARGLVRPAAPLALALPAWAAVHGLATLLVDRSPRLLHSGASAEDLARMMTETLMEGMAIRRRT